MPIPTKCRGLPVSTTTQYPRKLRFKCRSGKRLSLLRIWQFPRILHAKYRNRWFKILHIPFFLRSYQLSVCYKLSFWHFSYFHLMRFVKGRLVLRQRHLTWVSLTSTVSQFYFAYDSFWRREDKVQSIKRLIWLGAMFRLNIDRNLVLLIPERERASIPCRGKWFLCVQTNSKTHPSSYPKGIGVPYPEGKARPGRDADPI
jgi:hypothetical protein